MITLPRIIRLRHIRSWLGYAKKAQMLRRFPEAGHKYRAEAEGEIRILLYGHYRTAYLLKLGTDVDILALFHGAMDIDRYLHNM